MAFILARQMPLRQSLVSLPKRSSLAAPAGGISQVVAFHATSKNQILKPLPRELSNPSDLYMDSANSLDMQKRSRELV